VSTPFDTIPSPGSTPAFHVGQAVHVNAGAAWLSATVTSISHARIHVSYPGASSARFAGPVAPSLVRPADGARLQAVHEVHPGDEVVAFAGGLNAIRTLRRCGDGWWAIDYQGGDRAMVPPTAVLRLRDSHGSSEPAPRCPRGRRASAQGREPA